MTLTETCTCGASLSVTSQYGVERQAEKFREAHAPCRERTPAPVPVHPRARMYRPSRETLG
jgi:hypothetical protein